MKIYIDYDGVFNAPEPPHNDTQSFKVKTANSPHLHKLSTIHYSPHVVKTIDDLCEKYNIELIWLSSWNDNNHILSALKNMNGLHNTKVLTPKLNHNASTPEEWTQWKAEAIIADQTGNLIPFIWVDDKAPLHHGLRIMAELNVMKKIIVPKSTTGLSVDDLNAITDFIKFVNK